MSTGLPLPPSVKGNAGLEDGIVSSSISGVQPTSLVLESQAQGLAVRIDAQGQEMRTTLVGLEKRTLIQKWLFLSLKI